MNIVRNTNAEGTETYREKSRIGSINHRIWSVIAPMLFIAFGLFGVNVNAWGYAASKLTVKVSGQGQVAVTTSSTQPGSSSYSSTSPSDDQSDWGVLSTHTYYVWVKPNEGYRCTGVSECSWNNAGYYTISITGRTSQVKKEVTATFVGNSYTISFAGNSNTSGTMSDQSGFVYGTAKTLSTNTFGRAYTVTYDANGGSCGTSSATATYTFNGWKSSNGTSYANKASVSTFSPTPAHGATVSLTAQWKSASVTLPNATKNGAVLDGWYSGNTKIGDPEDTYTPTANITLTAKWISKYDFEITGGNYTINNEAWNKTGAFTFVHADEDHMTTTIQNPDVISYNRASNTITAKKIGTSKITFTQNTSTTVNNGSIVFTITVDSVANNLSVSGTSFTKYVDQEVTSVRSNQNSNGEITTTSSNPNLAHYDIANNKIVIPNSDAQKLPFGDVTITISQAATAKYKAKKHTITLKVEKYANTIKVKGSTNYSSSITVDSYDNELTLTADNTDYTNCPITNTQTAGKDIATFYQNDKVVYSSYKLGTATWTLSQPENYKYKAGSGSFTVNVIQQPAEECNVLKNDAEYKFNEMNDNTYVFDAPGDKVTFQIKKYSVATLNQDPVLKGYDVTTGKWVKLQDMSFTTSWEWKTYTINNTNIRKIKWDSDGENSWKYIRFVSITRKTYLNIATDNSSTNGTLTINKKSDGSAINPGQTGVAQSKIYWSCVDGGDLKIVCENPHFSFSQNTITNTTCNNGTTDITVSYTNTEAGTETATVTVYNQMYRQTFTVKGVIEKADQSITWHNDILRLGQSYTGVATANTLVTYESKNESIIRVDEDGEGHKTILTAVGTGTVNITATAEGSSFYAEKSDTKSIKVTEKQIQWIDWNQSLFGLKLGGANVTMNAVAASDVEGCGSSRLIEYSSNNESVVKVVNNNQLQIIGVGTAIITAVQAGGFDTDGHDYERAETEKTVIVRDPNAPCESFAYQQGQEVKMDCGWNALDKQTKTSEINFNGIIPATGTLRYKGEYRKVAINYFDGTMTVEQYIPGENWQPVTGGDLGKPSIGTYKTANLTFDRRATKMRVKVTDGLGYHYFTDCQVTQARFIETTAPVDFNLNVGQQQNQVIYLSYSNITDGLSLTLAQGANSHFSVDKSFIEGSCGSAAKNVALTITYHPTTEETNAQDVLTITDGTTSCQVVLTGSATRVNRHINWDHADETDIYTVQTETLSAEARTDLNELAGVVTFSLASSSTATGAISMENVLSFTSAGVANVVAYTTDDARYNAAPNVTKVFNVSKTPTTISTLPVLEAVTSGTAVGDVELTGWQVTNTVNGGVVEGTLAITSADLINVGTNTVTLTFTPSNTDMYDGCTSTTTIVVNKATSVATPSAANIVYGQKVSASLLSNVGTDGTWAWNTGNNEAVLDAGTYNDLAVHFTPTSGNYTELDATVTLTVEKAAASLSWTTAPTELAFNATSVTYEASSVSDGVISYSIVSGNDYAEINAETGVLTILVPGQTVTVQAAQTEGTNYLAPEAITINVTIGAAPSTNTFTNEKGDGNWYDPANWQSGSVPSSDPDIFVTGDLVIDEDITVGDLTIESTGSVAVISGGTLTVKGTSEDRTEYGDVHVMSDGALALGNNADLQVRDFTLDAKLAGKNNSDVKEAAASGQVENQNKMTINGDAYFQMTFDPKGKISFGWYDFVVPFPVNVLNGIFRAGDLSNHLVSGVDFLIREYSESRCSNKQNAWTNFNGTMQPGRVYTVTFNYDPNFDQNVFVFKNASSVIGAPETFATQYSEGSGDTDDYGWNGLGNGMLQHGYITGSFAHMQVYNHAENKYDLLTGKNPTFAIGTSFFVQVDHTTPTMTWHAAAANEDHPLYAPKRDNFEVEEFMLSLRNEDQVDASDHFFISASEEATEAYVIGRDLRKMGTPTAAKAAQMWATKGGKTLCDIETRMENDQASSDLNFFAPEAQTYTLSVEESPEDATLYLTYNDRIIWSLSASPYTIDLAKGMTEGYGLRIVARHHSPSVATGMDELNVDEDGNRKVLIDNMLYIITPEGAMYSVMGEKVK